MVDNLYMLRCRHSHIGLITDHFMRFFFNDIETHMIDYIIVGICSIVVYNYGIRKLYDYLDYKKAKRE